MAGAAEAAAKPTPSPGAARMRLYRVRKQRGLRCITIELFEREIDGLIRSGYLAVHERSDNLAVRKAVHALFDRIFPAR